MLKLLLKFDADVNKKTLRGFTALAYAVGDGDSQIVSLLLKNGANIRVRMFEDMTALMLAAGAGHNKAVRFLLARGANSGFALKPVKRF